MIVEIFPRTASLRADGIDVKQSNEQRTTAYDAQMFNRSGFEVRKEIDRHRAANCNSRRTRALTEHGNKIELG